MALIALDEEPDDGFPATPGVAHRDQAVVRRGLVGVDPDVVPARSLGAMASSATRTMNVSRPNIARPAQRPGAGDAHGTD